MRTRPIVLLTDFGLQDAYAGVLKGVIAAISPESKVIDLTHAVNPYDKDQGSFLLATSCHYFPKGSIFCVIVDPGVGSDRKGICIETDFYIFIGPDNGILFEAANQYTIRKIIHLTNTDYFLNPVSNTFHGRDVFAPVAAHISKGLKNTSVLGSPLEKCIEYGIPRPEKTDRFMKLTVIYADRFGNITLNLKQTSFMAFVKSCPFCLTINGVKIRKCFSSYSQADGTEFFLIGSSSSYMEIAAKSTSAAAQLSVAPGQSAVLEIFK